MPSEQSQTKRPRGRPLGTGKGRTARVELIMTPEGKAALRLLARHAALSIGECVELMVRQELTQQPHIALEAVEHEATDALLGRIKLASGA